LTSTTPPQAPRPDAPPPGAGPGGARPVYGRSDHPAAAHIHHVRVTAPDLARRAVLEKSRSRLLLAAGGFAILFAAVAVKLADATVIQPMSAKRVLERDRLPDPTAIPPSGADLPPGGPVTPVGAALLMANAPQDAGPHVRAEITDRNGEILALSLPTSQLYANPKEMMDTDDAAAKLKSVIPRLDLPLVRARLASAKQFVYLARNITPNEQLAVNNLGIPGIYFQPGERRRYPQGRVAAQVIGAVDIDTKGVAGVEKFFDQRLRDNRDPLRLSIDVRVQAAVRDELSKSMDEFQAIGACGIVMDVRTGEVIAMVSLPDFDANKFGTATPEERFNRAVTGMYEPGSTFKLQTAAMALDSGAAQLWSIFDAAHDIKIGRFTITDFEGKHRMLALPEVIAYSSNLGAAHIAQSVGAERQRSWLEKMGMFGRIGIELPEQGQPIVQKAENWKEVTTMTVGFGHGIAVSPLHVVRGTAAIANGGVVLRPTILAVDPDGPRPEGVRVMQLSTSDVVRKLMRLVVTDGYGKPADVPGYFVGGKTGTAEKVGGHTYKKHTNVSAFMSVFPMNNPRYAVYFMLDEPKGNKSTGGFSTAGAVSAPGAGRVIARIAPMLGLMPETTNAAAIQATLAIPMAPPHGYRSAPLNTPPVPSVPDSAPVAAAPGRSVPSPASAPVSTPALRPGPIRVHEASLVPAIAR
jgi:cell division protein FtsI (penicillin-binding protein 3)